MMSCSSFLAAFHGSWGALPAKDEPSREDADCGGGRSPARRSGAEGREGGVLRAMTRVERTTLFLII